MKELLQEVPDYWLNFALHTALLSAVAWAVCRVVRDAGRRAFLAAGGVFLIGVLPWISAFRPFSSVRAPVPLADVETTITPAWPEWTIRLEESSPHPGIKTIGGAPEATEVAFSTEWLDWKTAVIGLWIAGAVAVLGRLAWRQARLARWAGSLRSVDREEWRAVKKIGVLPRDQVRVAEVGMSPCAVGFFRPKAVLPRFLFEPGMERKLEWALRHEAEHLRAGDSRMAILLASVHAVMWWNPLVGWLCGVWAQERERVCDARASQVNGAQRDYGRFLLEMVERTGGQPEGVVAMAESAPAARLRRRLESLAKGVRVKEDSIGFRGCSSLCAFVVVIATSTAGVRRAAAVESPVASQAPAERIASEEKPGEKTKGDRDEAKRPDHEKSVGVQIKMASKFVLLQEPLPEAGTILDHIQMQALLRRFAAIKGTPLMTSPAVMAAAGQMAVIEISRNGDPIHPGEDPPFIGLRSKLVADISGDRITLRVDVQFNHAPGESPLANAGTTPNWPSPVPENFDWSSVRSTVAKGTRDLRPGETMVLAFQGDDSANHLIGFFTATLVDATGKPTDGDGGALPEPVAFPLGNPQRLHLPQWQGDGVKIRAAIVEFGNDGKLGPYLLSPPDGVPGFRSSFSNRHFEAIEAIAKSVPGESAWTSLATAGVSPAAPAVPWESFPVRIQVGPPDGNSRPVKLTLPGEAGEIEASGQLGKMLACELPGEGRKRVLLLTMEEGAEAR